MEGARAQLPEAARRQLRREGRGDLHTDDVWRAAYACDGSNYMILPLGVYIPQTPEDVSLAIATAFEYQFPVIMRGGGSGLAGEGLGQALIVDVSRHLNRIHDLDISSRTVRVDAGVVLDSLNAWLAPHELKFGPDPSSSSRAVMGALVANNSTGAHSPVYGHTRPHVKALDVVLSDGARVRFEPRPLSAMPPKDGSIESALYRGISFLIRQNAPLIQAKRPKTVRDRAGYLLYDVMDETHINLAKLVCPSEGTLVAITAAELAVAPVPAATGLVVLSYPSAVAAAHATQFILTHGPSAIELLDSTAIRCIHLAGKGHLLPPEAVALLFVEFFGESQSEVQDKMARFLSQLRRDSPSPFEATLPRDAAHAAEIWNVRKSVEPMQHRDGWKNGTVPAGFVEDAAVDPNRLGEYVEGLCAIMEKHQRKWGTYGHAAAGLLHTRVYLNLGLSEDVDAMQAIAEDVVDLVLRMNGTISGEHGTGLTRTQFVWRQYGDLFPVLEKVKRLFDPKNILNPGKIIGNEDPDLMKHNLRARPAAADRADITPLLNWIEGSGAAVPSSEFRVPSSDEENPQSAIENPQSSIVNRQSSIVNRQSSIVNRQSSIDSPQSSIVNRQSSIVNAFPAWLEAARHCTGCGDCRSYARINRMCPSFKDSPDEIRSTRARCNLMRMIARGDIPASAMNSSEFRDLSDYCLNCKMCTVFCPVSADGGKLMAEARAQRVKTLGKSPLSRLMAGAERCSELASGRWAPIFNYLFSLRLGRGAMQWATGFDSRRALPPIAKHTFFKRLRQRYAAAAKSAAKGAAATITIEPPVTQANPRSIVYFYDQFVNYHDPELGEAFLAIMAANNIRVIIPPQQGAGMPAMDHGHLPQARGVIQRNAANLAPYARQGIPIICTEPTAALALTKEYAHYLASEDVAAVAGAAREATDFLRQLMREGQLNTHFKSLSYVLGYHTPCHLQQFDFGRPGMELLARIPGVSVKLMDKGCCGLAGAFGWSPEQFPLSRKIAMHVADELLQGGYTHGATECSLCRMQLESASGMTLLHPIKILAESYQ
ncbi:MAG: FAD-binding protein [Candidatus Sumerlaeota bacterium]|nr:FAD-binding protein [Candidatus Sumerlaeota bacterium]